MTLIMMLGYWWQGKFFVYDVDDRIIELGVKVPHSIRKAGLPDL